MARGRKGSGGRRAREEALALAARLGVPAACDVAVIGGGASGLAAALAAAEVGASVVVLERLPSCGRTILATGNGRCNLANAGLRDAVVASDPAMAYHNAAFAAAVMGERPTAEVVRRFDALGLDVVAEGDRLYPVSRVAGSVLEVLVAACERLGVILACARSVRGLRAGAEGPSVVFDELWSGGRSAVPLKAGALIVACGGALTGGAEDGTRGEAPSVAHAAPIERPGLGAVPAERPNLPETVAAGPGTVPSVAPRGLIASLGVPWVEPRPSLCPLACADVPPELDGRRVRCAVSLMRDGQVVTREEGEVLFRSYGLSGIVIFDLSRVARPGDALSLDLAPGWSAARLNDRQRQLAERHVSLETQLAGLVDPIVAHALVERATRGQPCAPCVRRDAVRLLKDWRFVVRGTADEAHAQVTRGGIDVSALDPATLAVHGHVGLHACGEAIDVDGPCGGFNLGWAWLSGVRAGTAAVAHAMGQRSCKHDAPVALRAKSA